MESQNVFETHISALMHLIREKCPNEPNTNLLIGNGLKPLVKEHVISIKPSTTGIRLLHTTCGFKIAVTKDYSSTVTVFFSSLPSLLTVLIKEWSTVAIVTTLSSLCSIFIEVFSRSVIIENKIEWEILEYISFSQKRSNFPTAIEISRILDYDLKTIEMHLELLQKGKRTLLGRSISLVSTICINGNQCFKSEV